MKISILLKREPFKKIFSDTLNFYLRSKYKKHHEVNWHFKNFNAKCEERIQIWYCNTLINSIFLKNVNPLAFNSISGEYSINPIRPWRGILQKLYFRLSINPFFSKILANYVITISPPLENGKSKLIIGGNTKIRILDVRTKTVTVILKKGFNEKYFLRDIYVKKKFKLLPVPKMFEYDRERKWYTEELISGKSPNRLRNNDGDIILVNALESIINLLVKTKKTILLANYLDEIKARIKNSLKNYDSEVIININSLLKSIISLLKKHSEKSITVAFCHGDLHQGNIIYDGKESWILDWENSGEKQICYDLFILLIESRIQNNYANRFIKLLKNQFTNTQKNILNSWPETQWEEKEEKEMNMLIFLLEELDFYIDECSNKLFLSVGKSSIIGRIDEFKKIIKYFPLTIY